MSELLTDDPRLRDWVLAQLPGATAIASECTLIGGLTSDMRLLRIAGGPHSDVVLRRWAGRTDWQNREWQELCVHREAVALEALAASLVHAPELIAADPGGSTAGYPVTLMTLVEGDVDLAPSDPDRWLDTLASTLATIHSLPPPPLPPVDTNADLSEHRDRSWLADPGLEREALDLASQLTAGQDVFAHGDYQHFNLLWRDGALVNVVDWTGAGPAGRGLDVGHCRVNLAVLYSAEVAMRFLDLYEQVAGVRVDRSSDVRELLAFSPEWPHFIPLQVAGRAPVDPGGMAARVRETVRRTLRRPG